MALGDKYATRDELKTRTGIPSATSTYDSRLDDCLNTASRGIEKTCGRQFNVATAATARLFEPCSATRVQTYDISTTTNLAIKVDYGNDGTYETTLTSSQYVLRPLDGIVDGEAGWPYSTVDLVGTMFPSWWEIPPIQITATWGWAAVPSPVHEACLILAEELFKLSDTPFGIGGYGQFGIVRARENPFVYQRIAPYATQRAMLMVA